MINPKRAALQLAAFAGFGCVCAAATLPFTFKIPNFIIIDDGFFYSEIAYRLATDHRSTFDGIHTTSGYHLPWAFVLAAVSVGVNLFTHAKAAHLFAHLALSFAITGWTSRRFFRAPLLQLVAFVVVVTNFSLTEMVLAAPVILALMKRGPRETWFAFVLPIIRIDLLCVPLVLAVVDRRRALPTAALAGVAVQLALMKLGFGHIFSVAATLKAPVGLAEILARSRINLFLSAFQSGLFLAHAAIAGFTLALRRDRATWAMVLASLSFLMAHTVLSFLRAWYWVPSLLGLLYALESAGLTRASRSVVAALAGLFVVHAIRSEVVYAGDQETSVQFLAALKRIVPLNAPIFTFDNPGFVGFWSGRDVVDGDGLVNDHAYAARLASHRLAGYLDEEGLCWLVTSEADSDPLLARSGLVVGERDVTRFGTFHHHQPNQADFVVSRLVASRCPP